MIPPLKPGASLMPVDGPFIETARLILRPWRESDIAANTAMLVRSRCRALHHARRQGGHDGAGWMAQRRRHRRALGRCMVSPCSPSRRRSSGRYVGRVGPWSPPEWPGFEVGWGIAPEYRGKGYAVEAARASIDWVFATFEIDEIIHCIEPANAPSQIVARRLGARKDREGVLFGKPIDIWVTSRASWTAQN